MAKRKFDWSSFTEEECDRAIGEAREIIQEFTEHARIIFEKKIADGFALEEFEDDNLELLKVGLAMDITFMLAAYPNELPEEWTPTVWFLARTLREDKRRKNLIKNTRG